MKALKSMHSEPAGYIYIRNWGDVASSEKKLQLHNEMSRMLRESLYWLHHWPLIMEVRVDASRLLNRFASYRFQAASSAMFRNGYTYEEIDNQLIAAFGNTTNNVVLGGRNRNHHEMLRAGSEKWNGHVIIGEAQAGHRMGMPCGAKGIHSKYLTRCSVNCIWSLTWIKEKRHPHLQKR